jgi:hypothetical protein
MTLGSVDGRRPRKQYDLYYKSFLTFEHLENMKLHVMKDSLHEALKINIFFCGMIVKVLKASIRQS